MKRTLKNVAIWGTVAIASIFVIAGCSKKSASMSTNQLKSEFISMQDAYIASFLDSNLDGLESSKAYRNAADKSLKKVTKSKEKLNLNTSNTKLTKDLVSLSDKMLSDLKRLKTVKAPDDVTKAIKNNYAIGQRVATISDKYFDGGGLSSKTQKLAKKSSEDSTSSDSDADASSEPATNKIYTIGQNWTVPGQWDLTVTGVQQTDSRNQFDTSNPTQVVIVTYSYTNLGYTNSIQDLFIRPSTVIDSAGIMGSTYPATGLNSVKPTPVGAKMDSAQTAFGLKTAGGTVKILFSQYDSNSVKQTATFEIPIQ